MLLPFPMVAVAVPKVALSGSKVVVAVAVPKVAV